MATGFASRRRGRRADEDRFEMAADIGQMNRMAQPNIPQPNPVGMRQARRIKDIAQKQGLTTRTAGLLRQSAEMERQAARDAATIQRQGMLDRRAVEQTSYNRGRDRISDAIKAFEIKRRGDETAYRRGRDAKADKREQDKFIADLYTKFPKDEVNNWLASRGITPGQAAPPQAGMPQQGGPTSGTAMTRPGDPRQVNLSSGGAPVQQGQPRGMQRPGQTAPAPAQAPQQRGTISSFMGSRDEGMEFSEARRGEHNGQPGIWLKDAQGNQRFVGENSQGQAKELYTEYAERADQGQGTWSRIEQTPEERGAADVGSAAATAAAAAAGAASPLPGMMAGPIAAASAPTDTPAPSASTARPPTPARGQRMARPGTTQGGSVGMTPRQKATKRQTTDYTKRLDMLGSMLERQGIDTGSLYDDLGEKSRQLNSIGQTMNHIMERYPNATEDQALREAVRMVGLEGAQGQGAQGQVSRTVTADPKAVVQNITVGADAKDRTESVTAVRTMLDNPEANKSNLVDVLMESGGESIESLFGKKSVADAKKDIAASIGADALGEDRVRKLIAQQRKDPEAYERMLKESLYDKMQFWSNVGRLGNPRGGWSIEGRVRDMLSGKMGSITESPLAEEQSMQRRKKK